MNAVGKMRKSTFKKCLLRSSDLGEGRQHQLTVVLDVGRLLECFLIVQTFGKIRNKNQENRRENIMGKNGNLTLGRPGVAAH